jgi:hypothetical protein
MGDVGCTVRNFVDGCILDAHPIVVLSSIACAIVCFALVVALFGAIADAFDTTPTEGVMNKEGEHR